MFRRTLLSLTAATLIAGPALAGSHSMKKDIVDTAAEAGSFTTLLAAAEAAGLVDTLKGEGPLTVFAPTDDAFAALPEGTVDSLLLPMINDATVVQADIEASNGVIHVIDSVLMPGM